MRKLVVNADDAGLAASTDRAILRAFREGVVRAASLVPGGPTAEAIAAAAQEAGLDLGWHVNLTEGRALAGPARTLTDARGVFFPKHVLWERAERGALDPEEVAREVRAQRDWLAERGFLPHHVDGHNHVHLIPEVRAALEPLIGEAWVRVPLETQPPPGFLPACHVAWADAWRERARTPEAFAGYAFCFEPKADVFLDGLPARGATVEYMVHPGSRPGSNFTRSHLRDRETDVLCDPALRAALGERGFELVCFRDLAA